MYKLSGNQSRLFFTGLLLSTFSTLLLAQGTVELPASLADAGATITPVKVGILYSEGPAVDADGNLFFSEFTAQHRIWKVPLGDTARQWLASANLANGMEFDPQNRLVACSNGRILRYDASAKVTDTLAPPKGQPTIGGEVNDISIGPKGDFYFTNFTGGSVFYVSTTGQMTEFKLTGRPNGVEWIAEKGQVLVNANADNQVWVYSDGGGGKLENKKVKVANVNGPDGLTIDEKGNLYIASYGTHTVMVYDSTGVNIGKINVTAANVSNCVFGGPKGTTLYITGDGGCRKVELKVGARKSSLTPIHFQNTVRRQHANSILAPSAMHPQMKATFTPKGQVINDKSMPYPTYLLK